MRRRIHKQKIRRPVNKRRIARTSHKRFIGKTKQQMIKVHYAAGPREVEAHVLGPLAVHREAPLDSTSELFRPGIQIRKGWIVTHLRTGATIIGLSAHATFQQAMQIARELKGEDWSFGEFGKRPEYDARIKRIQIAYLGAGIRAGLKVRA